MTDRWADGQLSATCSHNDRTNAVEVFLDAWAAGDADKVISLFSEDAVFSASVGPEPGRTLTGLSEIAPAVRQMLLAAKGSQFLIREILPLEDGAVVTWTQTGTTDVGQHLNVKGIDVFKVRDGVIILKNAYRKVAQL